MKLLKVIWFDKIGIVVGEDEHTGLRKAYIGVGQGHSEEMDTYHIQQTGKKLNVEDFKQVVELLEDKP